jgi:UDP-glucose 4-epimerase
MKIIVTGGAGFVGSHLVDALVLRGAEVHIVDNLVTGNVKNLHPQAILHKENICSIAAKEIIKRVRPDVVFHLAAQVDVSRSIREPQYDANVNVGGTVNILQACCEASVKKLIFSSTCGVYGNLQKSLIFEDDLTAPISYYGLSKLAAESYIRLFGQLYGLSYTILRYANIYGPGQSEKGEGGVVAQFLSRIMKEKPIYIHGDGEQTRDFIYVKDVVSANLAAVNHGTMETIQISTASAISVKHLAETLGKIHKDHIQMEYRPKRTGDIRHSCLNNDKAHKELKWIPEYGLYKGLEETYRMYKIKGI